MVLNHALIRETRMDLSGGSQVFYIPRDWTQTFCLRLFFPIGTFLESDTNNGISALSIRMLLEGTKNKDFMALAEELESVGIEYQTFTTGIQFHCPTLLQNHLIQFLSEILCFSEPTRERFEQTLRHMRTELKTSMDDSDQLAFTRLRQLVFQGSVGALFPTGTKESLGSISFEDFLEFQKLYLSAQNLRIYVSGKIDELDFFESLDRSLRLFQKGKKSDIIIPHIRQTQQNQSYHVLKDRSQSSVVLGHQGIIKWSEDYSKLKVMDQILGQSMGLTCRLAGRLREDLGLCYSVFGDITSTASKLPGLFQAYIGTNPNTVEQALEEMCMTIQQFIEDGPEIGEVEDTRLQLIEGFVFQFETNASMVQLIYEKDIYKLEEDFLIREQEEIRNITCEDIHRVAAKHLHPEKFVKVVVGKDPIEGFEVID